MAKIELEPDKNKALPAERISVAVVGWAQDDHPAAHSKIRVKTSAADVSLSEKTLLLDASGRASLTVTFPSEPGQVQIIFEGDDISETLELEATTVSRIGNCPGSGPFEAGSTVNFEASGYDDYGNQMPVTAAWSLTGDVATLAENGNVRMNRPAKPSRYRSLSVSLRGLRRGSN